jgi:hypothetical protein
VKKQEPMIGTEYKTGKEQKQLLGNRISIIRDSIFAFCRIKISNAVMHMHFGVL